MSPLPAKPDLEIKMEDHISDSSDAELEAAIQVEPEVEPEVESSETSAPSASTSFKLPPNPIMPQDLSLIMEMVSKNEVVGSLPPISMSAAEKRKLVEQSLKGKGKDTETEIPQQKLQEEEEDTDSDSSSEFVTSSEDESEKEDVPMNQVQHQQLKQELDEFVGSSNHVEVESDSDSDEEGEGDESYGGLGQMGFESMEDSEDDGPATAGPITSLHEAPLPPVAQPPMIKLPEGEGVSLAGEVVSWMREKKVEVWLEKRRLEEEQIKMKEKIEEGNVSEQKQDNKAEGPANENEDVMGATTIDQSNDKIKSETEDTKEHLTEVAALQTSKEEGEVVEGGTVLQSTLEVPDTCKEHEEIAQQPKKTLTPSKAKAVEPKFTSSGTVVVRAMQSRPGAADEGWLEEGSVLCWEDGRVLGTVHETFGPLTSPFYTIRLPPPPFPYPSPQSLSAGSKLFYPMNTSYRSFVNMLTIRDPRFKGSDASNLYDEEIGEDEMEWSDDEMEAQAKRRRKQCKGSKAPGSKYGTVQNIPGLPNRPHFDYDHDGSETASLHGEAEEDNWETGSSFSTRSRKEPEPYDINIDDSPQTQRSHQSPNQRGGRGRGRGRGQGRDRGRGRGGSGGGGGRGHGSRGSNSHNSNNDRQQFSLPLNPMMTQPQYQQQYNPQPRPQQQYYPQRQQQQQNFPYFPQPQQSYQSYPYPQMGFTQQQHQPQYDNHNDTYEPNQPSTGMPTFPNYQQQQGYLQQQQQNFGSQSVPAINPRFAAQYAQMISNQSPQQGQGQAQGQQGYGYGYGSQNQDHQYSE
ncbi:hypothetical protein L486_01396 [Kwoniella mangroviensis CBS 10435]|uniref:H/ACA ribonucleoprotein complex non-core subunit NAF1 n=1 Tax=Kwoniella mangroviensis CBS 10435 TaxID=1331196 RepID=A0A1B9J1R4_9TREE|nr:hypothetical protein L486_01396 [Kwoniella mangroviensis CBS 10435]